MKSQDLELVRAYLDGELTPEEECVLRGRAAREPRLGSYLADQEMVQKVLLGLRSEPLPDWVVAAEPRWMGQLFRVGLIGTSLAAAAFLLLVTGLQLGSGDRHSPTAEGTELASQMRAQSQGALVSVQLTFSAPEARSVAVAGDFNGWKHQDSALKPGDRPGEWVANLALPRGR